MPALDDILAIQQVLDTSGFGSTETFGQIYKLVETLKI